MICVPKIGLHLRDTLEAREFLLVAMTVIQTGFYKWIAVMP